MTKTVDYYFFLLSPWSYLGTNKFNQIISKHNLTVNYKPIDVMKTFGSMGGTLPAQRHESRQKLRLDELKRWSDYLEVSINLHPAHWPTDQTLAAKMVLEIGHNGNPGVFVDKLLSAVWNEEKNISDRSTLIGIADNCGFDGTAMAVKAETEELQTAYENITNEAHAKSVFGSPTYIYNNELFWGQDRLDFLDRALSN